MAVQVLHSATYCNIHPLGNMMTGIDQALWILLATGAAAMVMVPVIGLLQVAGSTSLLAALDRQGRLMHRTTGYKYTCFNHMLLHIMLDGNYLSLKPAAPSLRDPLMWDSSQPCKKDACHTTCVMLTCVKLSN
jgi:hypothetical protein